jgi:hypothetical protein
MLHLKLFEDFTKDDIVTVRGRLGKVVSENEDDVVVKFFKPNRTKVVGKEEVIPQVKCLSQCDKRIVGSDDKRYIKCFFCGKEEKSRNKI